MTSYTLRIGHSIPIQLSGTAWTPNRDVNGNVLVTDFPQLPSNSWVTVVGTNNELSDIQPSPAYLNSGGNDGFPGIISAWGGGAPDRINNKLILSGGGHGDTSAADNGIYAVDLAAMKFQTLLDRDLNTASLTWNGSALVEGNGWPAGANFPTKTGRYGTNHTYNGLVHISAADGNALGLGSSSLGWLFYPGTARGLYNLSAGTWTKVWWKRSSFDQSYVTAVRRGSVIIFPRASFSFVRWDMAQTEATDWQSESWDSTPGDPSFGKDVTGATSDEEFVYNNRTFLDMPELGQMVSFAYTHQKIRYGEAQDAAASNWSSYQDTVTLSGADAADLNTASNYVDSGTNLLNGAGASYLHSSGEVFICPNTSGNEVYKITGLDSGLSGTVTKLTGSSTLTTAGQGTFGKFHVFDFASQKIAVRVSAYNVPLEIMRIV